MSRCSCILASCSLPESSCPVRWSPGSSMSPSGSGETDMTPVEALIAQGADTGMLRPWRRVRVGRAAWAAAGQLLADGQASLIGLWGDDDAVHIALLDEQSSEFAVLSHAV